MTRYAITQIVSETTGTRIENLVRLHGGLNSAVYAFTCAERRLIAKFYPTPDAGRDRLQQEYDAVTFLWHNGIRQIPAPFLCRPEKQLAIYAFVDGRGMPADDIRTQDIDAATAFIAGVNELRAHSDAVTIGNASDAGYSPTQIADSIEHRIQTLRSAPAYADASTGLAAFLEMDLVPAYQTAAAAAREMLDPMQELPLSHRVLSPSDFGFHNGLKSDYGWTFLDFEHFGWDDPAKIVCDFALHPHPAMDIAPKLKEKFRASMQSIFSADTDLEARTDAYTPLFACKWACILLNEFVPRHIARRRHATDTADLATTRKTQLAKAQRMLESADALV
ncbi:MAG: hypothetical protein CME19_17200 [Gemmatimonadetes bacterium]|nr:hypothetical protein [Gemmatimonadota bacterium]|tara:strand:+ start:3168 stop:4172 length:1005 start_codon:yes stop_codon:yes gene_type:complete